MEYKLNTINLLRKLFVNLKTKGGRETCKITYNYVYNVFKNTIRGHLNKSAKIRFQSNYPIDFSEDLIPPDYLDLENLIKQITEKKPNVILELGGGQSTSAIIYGLMQLKKQGHQFTFVSVDQSEYYLQKTKDSIPIELRNEIVFHHSKLTTKIYENTLMSFFENIPDLPYDFVYEDRCDHEDTVIAGDILLLEQKAIGRNINFSFTIDTMTETKKTLERLLQRRYKISGELLTGTNFTQLN